MTKAPTPDKHAAPMRLNPKATSEHEEQSAVVDWLRAKGVMVYAVPNGAKLGGTEKQRYGMIAKLKREGLMPGAPDLVVVDMAPAVGMDQSRPVAIEMKSRGKKPSNLQKSVHNTMRDKGWIVIVADSFESAREQLEGLGF